MEAIYANRLTEAEAMQVEALTYDIVHISQNTVARMSEDDQEHLLERLERLQHKKKLYCTLRKFAGCWKVRHIIFDVMGGSTELHTEFADLQAAINFIYTMKEADPYIIARI